MTEEESKPFTIDGVQINPDELSDQCKHIVARLHKLANERNALLVKLQEKDIVIKAFRNQLIADYQKDETVNTEEGEKKEAVNG
jgi:hypothetical protein